MGFTDRGGARRARRRAVRRIVFPLTLLIGAFLTGGIADAAKPPNTLKSKALQSREAQVKLYERTLRSRLASDPYPLIDLEISLDQLEGARRYSSRAWTGPASRSARSPRQAERRPSKRPLKEYPGRLIPLTIIGLSGRLDEGPGGAYLSSVETATRGWRVRDREDHLAPRLLRQGPAETGRRGLGGNDSSGNRTNVLLYCTCWISVFSLENQ